MINESLILAILRNYSTKPSYIFQLKREIQVWKYIFSLFHLEMLIQNRNPKFRPLCLFVLTFHEYEARFVFGLRLDYKLSLFDDSDDDTGWSIIILSIIDREKM
jgi:hypothetical protein